MKKSTTKNQPVLVGKKSLVKSEKSEKEVGKIIATGGDLAPEQLELIKQTIAKGASDDELRLFLNVCRGTNLNPFLRQVHLVPRWDNRAGKEVRTIQVGIDGFRAIAEEGGQYAGSDDAIFREESEIEVGGKFLKKIKRPGQATVAVYKLMRNGQRYPFTATARWDEYYPGEKQGYMWHKMPYGQLGKCAEALALRKAFPKLLSGFYAPEEMEQAQGNAPAGETINGEIVATGDQALFLKAIEMIKQVKDAPALQEFKEKISTSQKYNDEQKTDILIAIDARLTEILKPEAEEFEKENNQNAN